jgi:hypothetical protein
MSSTQQHELKTIRDIAKELGKHPWNVSYLIDSRGIQETRRVGIIRLFDAAAVEQIKEAAAEVAKAS